MSTDPEQLRADIEETRTRLSDDVDALADEANPKRIVQRQTSKAKQALTGAKDRVMGAASDTATASSQRLADKQNDAKAKVSDAGDTVRRQAEGNPLAAGLIAFGAGLLVSSLFRSSEAEQHVAAAAKEKLQPLADEAKLVAKDAADDLKGSAQESVESVRETASDAVDQVKGSGTSAVQDIQGQAAESKDAVQESRRSGN